MTPESPPPSPHDLWMAQALRLARRGQGRVEPNPMVGCVLVRQGRVIGEGYHRKFGGPHAEVDALRRCDHPRGATAYVTLEPCAHHGKTPPCTDALIAAGVKRVVIAMTDPFPKVAGRGAERLRAAGIDVIAGVMETEARRLNAPYLIHTTHHRPWVIAKWAQTLDGRIATRHGHSQWISGQASRRFAHQLRARVDAVIVGIGTARLDNPRLDARDVTLRRTAQPIVIDPRHELSPSSHLAKRGAWSVTAKGRGGAIELPALKNGRLDLRPLLRTLADEHGMTNVLVEGGGKLLGSFFAQKLIDEAYVFLAPKLMGDAEAVPAVAGLSPRRIPDALPLSLQSSKRVGDDVLLHFLAADERR